MALMLGKLYDALIAANVPPDKARDAASEVAVFENRLAKLEADISLIKWMLGFNLAMTATLIAHAFLAHT